MWNPYDLEDRRMKCFRGHMGILCGWRLDCLHDID
jgi:hypothetical protein